MISRTGRYKAFPVAGLALMALGLALLSGIGADTAYGEVAALLVLFGLGFGMVSQVLTIAIQNAVERSELGITTASANLFRSLGGVGGGRRVRRDLRERLAGPTDPARGVSPEAVASALHTVFLAAAPVAALGALVVLTLKEVPLRHA